MLYLLGWAPIAGMLVVLLAAQGAVAWLEAALVVVPLCITYAFVCLSSGFLCRALPLGATGVFRLVLMSA
ncbi:MAG: hypothetical protein FJW40_27055 [Acidobacteria bacterium]|nr:hypothetical protein [Acidobacteriota bacterium]